MSRPEQRIGSADRAREAGGARRRDALTALVRTHRGALEIARLAEFNRTLARCLDLNVLLRTACQSARALVRSHGATFVLREGNLVHYAADDAIAPLWAGQRFPIARCISGWAMLKDATAVVEDIYADERIPTEAYEPTFVRSLVMAPVRIGHGLGGVPVGEPVAAMGVYWARRHRATEREVRLIEALADAAGIALANARLFEEMKRARLAAEEASRAKDVFLATLSHELRTPIAPIMAWARLLREGRLDPERVKHAGAVIERCSTAERRLVEDILDVSRIVTGKFTLEIADVDFLQIVRDALRVVQPVADAKGVRLEAALPDTIGAVRGDGPRLEQVCWNLLSNAIKFTPAGGHARVSVGATVDGVELRVADSGCGIDAAFLPRVFDRFLQGDGSPTRAHEGLGLGLAIVRHIVELHGGEVRAHSDGPGTGATFIVTLPRGSAAAR
ncbi:MAG TPA: GAF domain-containing sensor histidine kinase [Candidatus Binatia bacterium]|nr:GAF domain-containing sensor histidine kinase [Candidatus Binatia bacterium]